MGVIEVGVILLMKRVRFIEQSTRDDVIMTVFGLYQHWICACPPITSNTAENGARRFSDICTIHYARKTK